MNENFRFRSHFHWLNKIFAKENEQNLETLLYIHTTLNYTEEKGIIYTTFMILNGLIGLCNLVVPIGFDLTHKQNKLILGRI